MHEYLIRTRRIDAGGTACTEGLRAWRRELETDPPTAAFPNGAPTNFARRCAATCACVRPGVGVASNCAADPDICAL